MAAERFALDGNTAGPTAIYHYTDPKGLLGILSDGQLWATDNRYLNDSSEIALRTRDSPGNASRRDYQQHNRSRKSVG
jgi:hypothetical protein